MYAVGKREVVKKVVLVYVMEKSLASLLRYLSGYTNSCLLWLDTLYTMTHGSCVSYFKLFSISCMSNYLFTAFLVIVEYI